METFYWYDYETWGSDPRVDKPVQFAGVRTDSDLNIIGDPTVLFCKPSLDMLPHPEACLIHKFTPQQAEEEGVSERLFAAAIHQELSQPQTCTVGYNNIGFDDEVTRHLFYRNFYPAYEREYKNGNSRWDMLDVVRACYALRPEGINWPVNEDGKPSFKLEHMAAANGLEHEKSHNALSDVYATIAVARMVRDKQPRLFEYLHKLRNKHEAWKFFNLTTKEPVLNVSGMISTDRRCAALMMPLAVNQKNKNEIICYDLSVDPSPLIELDAEEIRKRVFSSNEELNGIERIPLKGIHVNRCPAIFSRNVLTDDIAHQLKINKNQCDLNRKKLLADASLLSKLRIVYGKIKQDETIDPERMLYHGFIEDEDQSKFHLIRSASGVELSEMKINFIDGRLPEILFRYKARNFSDILSANELKQWKRFCYQRITNKAFGGSIVVDECRHTIDTLNAGKAVGDNQWEILDKLSQYINALLSGLGDE